ncbi:DUF4089 domain-containing protein [Roseomonas sp. GC11]|uniref:AtzG-like protein n=1 Tax=Roseomonas sp. GC11 TaxID=2950546 RepID=UPI00210C93C1|nr:AtzG-like protein [Roseomonas sp. GC11]MCQ4162369.1 DUF4089 domain-containing protein [Roseomonas sp. GC11]
MTEPLPPVTEEEARAAVALAARLAGVPLREEWQAAAATSYLATVAAARLVLDFPLEDEAEYAPVFRPVFRA